MLSRANQDAALTDFTTAMGATAKLALFINTPPLSRTMAFEDFELATFTGSTPKTITTWTDPYTNVQTGERMVTGLGGAFIATAVPTPETIRGYLVLNAAADDWEYVRYLDKPVAIAKVGDGVNLDANVPYGD